MERNINVWLPLTRPLNQGPGQQPRHVPSLGIELATLWFAALTQSPEPDRQGSKSFLVLGYIKNISHISNLES